MLSINTNSSALTALQALNMTQQAMNQTQQQVSTGYAVNSAADNSSYWSIGQQLNSDNDIINASNTALAESQAVLSTAASAISSIQTTINSIQSALTQAASPGADTTNTNTTLSVLGQQLQNEVSGATFNGINLLNQTSNGAADSASLNFVSGFQASSNGGSFTYISLSQSSVYTPNATANTAGTGMLVQSVASNANQTANPTIDITQLSLPGSSTGSGAITGVTIDQMQTAVSQAEAAVINYAAQIGATQDQMTSASNFNQSLTTNYANGASALVDADMNVASTRLQALQTQQQLGIQSLSIANQNSQLILKLFNG